MKNFHESIGFCYNMYFLVQVGQLIMYYTPKKVLPFAFFLTYQVFKNREGIISRKILAEGLGILVSQNNLLTISLIRVQGDCPYILFSSFSKLF